MRNPVRWMWRRIAPIPGTKVQIGARSFIVPEATLEVAERVLPALDGLQKSDGLPAQFSSTCSVMCMCLELNYPGLSPKAMKRLVPFGKATDTLNQILGAAGFVREVPAEGKTTGEADRPQA